MILLQAQWLRGREVLWQVEGSNKNKKNEKKRSCIQEVQGFKPSQYALVPFGKAFIYITKSLREDLKQSVPWLLTYKQTFALLKVR